MPSGPETLRAKTPLPIALSSMDWDIIHAGIKRQAIFTAMVDELSIIQSCRELAAQVLAGQLSKTEARQIMNQILAKLDYMPADPHAIGTIGDLATVGRQNLILETNTRLAASAAENAAMRGSTAYPAKRLVRLGERTMKRDWPSRWRVAYGSVGGKGACLTDMVALSESPIWAELSRFRTNAAPLDYNSGMGFEYVDYEEADRLGLINDEVLADIDEQAKPPATPPDANLQATLTNLSSDLKEAVKKLLGQAIAFQDDDIIWKGSPNS
ncbi:MAG: hypothetical protein R3Y56_02275 [Akkermansia sp.]